MFIIFTAIMMIGVLIFVLSGGRAPFGAAKFLMNETVIASSKNYHEKTFFTDEDTGMGEIKISTLLKFFMPDKSRRPQSLLPQIDLQSGHFNTPVEEKARVTWFGHSTSMIEMDGKRILLDPMFSDVPAPYTWLGSSRYNKKLPMTAEALPDVDAVIISHDHYDHLDHQTILKIKDKVGKFFVPLGVGSHLVYWGVDKNKIVELDWWEKTHLEDIQLVFTPARHFSGRGVFDGNMTLWGSWVIKGKQQSIFFTGDSGYSKYFKQIGEQYGPFDLTMVECGQYHEDWAAIHMMPEEAVQAHIDLKGKQLMPVHWGAFTIALHTWKDPVERMTAAAKASDVDVIVPKIGETFSIGQEKTLESWWATIK